MPTPMQAQPPLQAQRPPTAQRPPKAHPPPAAQRPPAAHPPHPPPWPQPPQPQPPTTCNFYALAERRIFPIEDLKGRQTDVRDFLLGQNKSPCVVLRRYCCGCGCRCSTRHRQRNPGRAQCQGCLATFPFGTSPHLRHGRASASGRAIFNNDLTRDVENAQITNALVSDTEVSLLVCDLCCPVRYC